LAGARLRRGFRRGRVAVALLRQVLPRMPRCRCRRGGEALRDLNSGPGAGRRRRRPVCSGDRLRAGAGVGGWCKPARATGQSRGTRHLLPQTGAARVQADRRPPDGLRNPLVPTARTSLLFCMPVSTTRVPRNERPLSREDRQLISASEILPVPAGRSPLCHGPGLSRTLDRVCVDQHVFVRKPIPGPTSDASGPGTIHIAEIGLAHDASRPA
jgi:hypothetical protein